MRVEFREGRGQRPYFITEFEKVNARTRRNDRIVFWAGSGLVIGVLLVAYWWLKWLWGEG